MSTIKTAIGPTILLGSGTYFDYLDPENSEISIEDYAAGIAFESRFQGQCINLRTRKRLYYATAQHVVIGSYHVPEDQAYAFLMHESGEPVCGDMVAPLKAIVPGYRPVEKSCESAIAKRFGVVMTDPALIKQIDLRMWATERQQLMNWDGQPWGGDGFGDPDGGIQPLPVRIVPVGPYEAYDLFMARWRELAPAHIRERFDSEWKAQSDQRLPKLSKLEQQALTAWFHGSDLFFTFRAIHNLSKVPEHQVRRAVRALARKGYARFGRGLFNDDGEAVGSGYGLTKAGQNLLAQSIPVDDEVIQ